MIINGVGWLHTGERTLSFPVGEARTASDKKGSGQDGLLKAPMPGTVRAVNVTCGDNVKQGQCLAVLEAMKMEYQLSAPFDGVVKDIFTKVNDQLPVGAQIIQVARQ